MTMSDLPTRPVGEIEMAALEFVVEAEKGTPVLASGGSLNVTKVDPLLVKLGKIVVDLAVKVEALERALSTNTTFVPPAVK